MKIYIVNASKGSYDDYSSWIEKAFILEENAEEYCKRYNELIENKRNAQNELNDLYDKIMGLYMDEYFDCENNNEEPQELTKEQEEFLEKYNREYDCFAFEENNAWIEEFEISDWYKVIDDFINGRVKHEINNGSR